MPSLIDRKEKLQELENALKNFPVVSIIGPRQCGKTTLAKLYAESQKQKKVEFFDLENPRDYEILQNPILALEKLDGYVIIDEIQIRPELFPVIRVLADKQKAKFIILGSASPKLLQLSSESLAGRIYHLELGGFSIDTLEDNYSENLDVNKLWLRGGFPLAYLAKNEQVSSEWRQEFIKTFLERDIPNLGIQIPPRSLRRFWMMLAHYHGQKFNASEIGRSIGSSDQTARKYLDILTGTFMIRELQPWYYNTKKRLVKSPKIYFRDSGLFHSLLSINTMNELKNNPKLGASWEGFALEQVIQKLKIPHEECFFWSLHSGPEIDLVFMRNGKTYGIEFKFSDSPKLEKSMLAALEELELANLMIIYPGDRIYELKEKIIVYPLYSEGWNLNNWF